MEDGQVNHTPIHSVVDELISDPREKKGNYFIALVKLLNKSTMEIFYQEIAKNAPQFPLDFR